MAIRKLEIEFHPAAGQDPEAFDKWVRVNRIKNVLLVAANGNVFMMSPGSVQQATVPPALNIPGIKPS